MTATPTLMTAAEMRTHLIEKRRELEDQRAIIAAEQAAREAERLKVWAPTQLAKMLETLMGGASEASHSGCEHMEAEAIVDLARSLGYEASVEFQRPHFVVSVSALEVAPPSRPKHNCEQLGCSHGVHR